MSALFRAAVGTVQPLSEQNRITPRSTPRKPLLRASATPMPDTLSDYAAEIAPDEHLNNGLSRMNLRKMRRGTWPIQDRLNLHGNHADAARKLLQEFLHEATRRKPQRAGDTRQGTCNSRGGEAVLRRLTRHWLTQHPRVLAYCDAPAKDGGSGAVLVLLKSG